MADSTSTWPYSSSKRSGPPATAAGVWMDPVKSSGAKPASAGGAGAAGGGGGGGTGAAIVITGIAIVAVVGISPAGRESSASTWRRSCWESKGFETIASQPSRSARSRSKGSKVPDRSTTGIRAVAGFALIASQTS